MTAARVASLLLTVGVATSVASVTTVLTSGCGKSESSAIAPDLEPKLLEHHHECEACGMIVAEQTNARAQLVHRDGTRAYFCSIGDMMVYLDAPSRHGKVLGRWVESMDPAADPRVFSMDKRPWISAEQASYVTGIDKPRVMGKPVMVYQARPDADAIAEKYGGAVIDWTTLRSAK